MNARILVASAMITMSIAVVAMDNKNGAVDIRKFGLGFAHNTQDEHKNTFWHRLALKCEGFDDWSDVEKEKAFFKENNKDWLPNPLIENEKGNSARREAKASFKRSGNPVCGLLVFHLWDIEREYLNTLAVKESQRLMLLVQQGKYPESLKK